MIFITGCTKKEAEVEKYTSQFYETFVTVVDVAIYSADENFAKENLKYTEDRFNEFSMLFDNYKSYPNLANVKTINENAGLEPIKVDDTLYDLIKESIDNYHKYSHKNNIALGRVIKLWNSYRDLYNSRMTKNQVMEVNGDYLPELSVLENLREYTDIDKIKLDDNEKRLYNICW